MNRLRRIQFDRPIYPVPRWLRYVLLAFSLVILIDALLSASSQGDPLQWALVDALALAAVAVVGMRVAASELLLAAAAVISLLSDAPYGILTLAFAVCSVTVTATNRKRWMLVHFGLLVAWIVAYWGVHIEAFPEAVFLWEQLLFHALASGVGVILRLLVFRRLSAEARIRELEDQARHIRTDERVRLARDLHDVVAHELTSIALQAASRRRSHDSDELHATLQIVDKSARRAITELREVLEIMRQTPEDGSADAEAPPKSSLSELVEQLAEDLCHLGYEADTRISVDDDDIGFSTRITCARILVEATTNIAKYAPKGSACRLEVVQEKGSVVLLATNALSKRTPRRLEAGTGGYGLQTMTERARMLNAEIHVGPIEDEWRVQVIVPVSAA